MPIRVVRAVQEQAADLTHCTTMFYHPVPAHLAEELAATMPAGPDWVVHFTNSGAEAVDLALLMARSYTGNIDFLSLSGGYHGATRRPVADRHRRLPPCRAAARRHRLRRRAEPVPRRLGPGSQPYLDEIDRHHPYATSGRLAGMIVEPVQGYGGIVPMPAGYIAGAAERVRAAGGLLVIDEVQSGFARTGDHFWAFEAHGVVPDIVVMAKGIGNGIPLGAVVAQRHVAEAMADKFLFHTYGANPVACAAGRAVLQVIAEESLQANAQHRRCRPARAPPGPAAEVPGDRRRPRPRPDDRHRAGRGSRHQGAGDRSHREGLRSLAPRRPGAQQIRPAPQRAAHGEDVETVAEGLERCFATL